MRKHIFIIVALLFLISNVSAQNDTASKHQIGFEIGINQNFIKDYNFSPLNQKGNGILYGLKYKKQVKNIFSVKIQYSDGNLYSGPSNVLESIYIQGNIQLAYLFNVHKTEKSFNTFFGLAYNTRALYFDWYNQDSFSFIASHGISLKALYSKQFGSKHLLKTSVAIPLVNFVSRPPYNGIDEYIIANQDNPATILFNGKLSSVDKYFGVDWKASYAYAISPRINWGINYQLLYQFENQTPSFKGLTNIYTTGLTYKF